MTKFLKLVGASLAALIAGADLPQQVQADLDAAAKDRKNPLPPVVRFAGVLRRWEGVATRKRAGWTAATRAKLRTARALAVTESAKLGYVA